jgi:hypothetical protein
MCFSRREWFDELARHAREEQELQDLLDREAERRRPPTFASDAEAVTEAEEREPVGARD